MFSCLCSPPRVELKSVRVDREAALRPPVWSHQRRDPITANSRFLLWANRNSRFCFYTPPMPDISLPAFSPLLSLEPSSARLLALTETSLVCSPLYSDMRMCNQHAPATDFSWKKWERWKVFVLRSLAVLCSRCVSLLLSISSNCRACFLVRGVLSPRLRWCTVQMTCGPCTEQALLISAELNSDKDRAENVETLTIL